MAAVPQGPEGLAPTGRDRWYEKDPGTPLDRFPLLADALAAVAKAWTESFCALSASPGEVCFRELRAVTVGDFVPAEDRMPIFATIRVHGWDGHAGLALDRSLVSTVVEALFGGGGDDAEDAGSPERPVSPVEMRIVDVIGGQAATALTAGFRAFSPTRFEFERTQPKPNPQVFGKPGVPLLAVAFELKALGRTTPFQVVLPLGGFEQRAKAWGGGGAARPVGDDAAWTTQLRAEVSRAQMALQASVAMAPVTLGAISRWRVGDVLELPAAAGSNVVLACGNEALFRCDLGQSAGRYTLRVDERVTDDDPPSRKAL